MDASLIIPSAAAALSVGMGCGTCCSPVLGAFLSTYVISHAEGTRKSLLHFAGFFGGRLVSVSLLCLAAAALGRQFLSDTGAIGSVPYRLMVQLAMSGLGVVMTVRWIAEQRRMRRQAAGDGHSCKICPSCKKPNKGQEPSYPIFAAGLLYGITPCPPLVLILSYCAALPVLAAGAAGISFAIASLLSPVLMLAILLGILSKKIRVEIPAFLKWFRLASYLLLMLLPFLLPGL